MEPSSSLSSGPVDHRLRAEPLRLPVGGDRLRRISIKDPGGTALVEALLGKHLLQLLTSWPTAPAIISAAPKVSVVLTRKDCCQVAMWPPAFSALITSSCAPLRERAQVQRVAAVRGGRAFRVELPRRGGLSQESEGLAVKMGAHR